MCVNHTEVDKEYFLNPETKANENLSVEDCCICKKLFYNEEELKKHEDERTRMWTLYDTRK